MTAQLDLEIGLTGSGYSDGILLCYGCSVCVWRYSGRCPHKGENGLPVPFDKKTNKGICKEYYSSFVYPLLTTCLGPVEHKKGLRDLHFYNMFQLTEQVRGRYYSLLAKRDELESLGKSLGKHESAELGLLFDQLVNTQKLVGSMLDSSLRQDEGMKLTTSKTMTVGDFIKLKREQGPGSDLLLDTPDGSGKELVNESDTKLFKLGHVQFDPNSSSCKSGDVIKSRRSEYNSNKEVVDKLLTKTLDSLYLAPPDHVPKRSSTYSDDPVRLTDYNKLFSDYESLRSRKKRSQ